MRRAIAAVFLALLGSLALAGCGRVPADVDGTLERVRGGELVVGVTDDAGHLSVRGDGAIEGEEAEILAAYAASLGASLRVEHGSETDIVGMLERGEIDLAAGGFRDDSPWSGMAAMTRPYGIGTDGDGERERLALLTRLGENAFLDDLERFLHEDGHEA